MTHGSSSDAEKEEDDSGGGCTGDYDNLRENPLRETRRQELELLPQSKLEPSTLALLSFLTSTDPPHQHRQPFTYPHTMPTVLITGLNGFLAVHTALVFLSHDWSVRGTVRSSAKAENTKKLPSLSKYVADGRVELVVVEDLIKGDFSEALKGVDAVSHYGFHQKPCRD